MSSSQSSYGSSKSLGPPYHDCPADSVFAAYEFQFEISDVPDITGDYKGQEEVFVQFSKVNGVYLLDGIADKTPGAPGVGRYWQFGVNNPPVVPHCVNRPLTCSVTSICYKYPAPTGMVWLVSLFLSASTECGYGLFSKMFPAGSELFHHGGRLDPQPNDSFVAHPLVTITPVKK
jgi:hypothetical protein